MSVSCDDLARSMLSVEEKKEEVDRLQSLVYDAVQEIKALKNEFEDYQADGNYEEMESIMGEICTLQSEYLENKSALADLSPSSSRSYF